MRTYFLLFFCSFTLLGFGQNYYPPSDPTWQLRTDLSDDFTTGTLDCSGGGVYYLNYANIGSPSWSFVGGGSGWWGTAPNTEGATCLAVYGNNVYAGTPLCISPTPVGGLFNSSGGGAWTSSSLETPIGISKMITAVAFNNNGTSVYVGTEGGVFVGNSNNTGWSNITPAPASTTWDVTSLAVSGSNLFVGTYGSNGMSGGIELYNGSSWTAVNTGLTNTLVTSLDVVSGTSLVAGTNGSGVFYSSNNGASWTSVNGSGLTNLQITTLALDGGTLVAGTNAGIFYSNSYMSYSPVWSSANSSGLTNTYITSLAIISPGVIVAGTNGGGVFYSTNYSSFSPTWVAINGSGSGALPSLSVSSLAYDGSSQLYVGICPLWHVLDCHQDDCCGGNTPTDVSINSSGLTLKDGRLSYPTACYINYYDQGTVQSYNPKYDYGYYEMYAQTPYTASIPNVSSPSYSNNGWDKFHPNFWAYYDIETSACQFVSHQEIDIFEPGGSSYFGTTNVMSYWHDDGSCNDTRTVGPVFYTYPGYLYSGYHKYGVEFGANRMIYYFDGVPVYAVYNHLDFALEGLFLTQISAQLDVSQSNPNVAEPYAVGDPSPLTQFYYIKYFHYYKLNLNCSTAITCTNDITGALGTLKLTGGNAYMPAVYSSITIAPATALSLSSGDNSIFRGVNNITIQPTGTSGSFSVPVGETLALIPNTCDY